jgi:pimeloyl-ACP methyl ester carboxylesterase
MTLRLEEPAPIRTLDELRAEAIARVDRNAYPLIGLDPQDVRAVFAGLTSLDRDEWARAWSAVGDRFMAAGRPVDAWRYYSFARWPVPLSPEKTAAYGKALDAYRAAAAKLDPPLEIVRIPFEGAEIVGYLRLPRTSSPAPLVFAIGGLDSRKEDLTDRFAPLLEHGVGSFTLDMPGTGEAPIRIAPGAERMFSRALDVLLQRPEIDARRVAIYGGSFGGYWSTKLAVTERERVVGVVSQAPPVDIFFSSAFAATAFTNREYLFDLGPAMMSLYDGVATIDDFLRISPQHSLVAQGFIDQPAAPTLLIAGALDTQVPIADIELLLHSGETPKEAWINPAGGHMGRDARGWGDPVIFARVTTPWLLRILETLR